MATTTAYRADGARENVTSESQTCLDVLAMMIAPCLPLARASAMVGCPFIVMFLLVAAFYIVGLWAFTSFYAQDGYVLLKVLSGWTVIFAGWFLYVVGPMVAIPILAAWYVKAFGCSLNDTGEPPCNPASEEPDRAALAVGCFIVVFIFTLTTCEALLREYAKDQRGCSDSCLACCVPCCAVERATRIAREARARAEHQDQEIPAYEA